MAYETKWFYYGNKRVSSSSGKQLGKDILSADTFRFKFTKPNFDPRQYIVGNYDEVYGITVYYDWTKVSDDIWDCHVRGISAANGYNCIFSNAIVNFVIGHDNYASLINTCDTSSITQMKSMFSGCDRLTSVPLFDTSSVTDMHGMFNYCSFLTNVPLFDTSSVTDMTGMFQDCHRLASVPLFNTVNVQTMYRMFRDCWDLVTVNQFDLTSITEMPDMFYNCRNVESGALALYQAAAIRASQVQYFGLSNAFYNCGVDTVSGLAELQQIPESWGGLANG